MTLAEKIARAKELGKEEALRDKPRVPAHVPELMEMLKGSPIGGDGIPVIKAFTRAMTLAILAAPVPE